MQKKFLVRVLGSLTAVVMASAVSIIPANASCRAVSPCDTGKTTTSSSIPTSVIDAINKALNGKLSDYVDQFKNSGCGFVFIDGSCADNTGKSDNKDCNGSDCNKPDENSESSDNTDKTPITPTTPTKPAENNNDESKADTSTDTEKETDNKNNDKTDASEKPAVSTDESFADYANEVLRLVNIERAKEGLSALTLETKLCDAANVRAEEIVKSFSHTRPDGTSCFTAVKDAGYTSYKTLGENIAAGQKTPEAVVTAWMNSEGHRANIMSKNFTKLGVGYVNTSGGYGHYWVQMFAG